MKEQTIADEDDGIRLDRWFKRHFPGLPHALLEKHLRKGVIRLNGKKAKSSDRIEAGQVIAFPDLKSDTPKRVRAVSPQEAEMVKKWVLYKDENIIVINKPAGLAAQGGKKITNSVDEMLIALADDKGHRPKLVHRLDRDTSGCLVLARNAKVATAIMHFFSGRQVNKTYLAIVNNLPDPMQGTITLPISKKENPRAQGTPGGPEGRDYEIMMVDEEEGQKAVTEYRVLDHLSRKFALLELKPLTGRTHQLRVHMQAIGCPILGDHKYGGSNTSAESVGVENKLHLHAWRIAIPSSARGKAIEVAAPLPDHMRKSFVALGLDVKKYL